MIFIIWFGTGILLLSLVFLSFFLKREGWCPPILWANNGWFSSFLEVVNKFYEATSLKVNGAFQKKDSTNLEFYLHWTFSWKKRCIITNSWHISMRHRYEIITNYIVESYFDVWIKTTNCKPCYMCQMMLVLGSVNHFLYVVNIFLSYPFIILFIKN